MAVCVDELVPYRTDEMKPAARHLGDRKWCHLFAATEADIEELHAFAAKLGLKRSYFQDARRWQFKHYDLTENKRAMAVRLGAVEIDRMERGRQTAAQITAEGWTNGGG